MPKTNNIKATTFEADKVLLTIHILIIDNTISITNKIMIQEIITITEIVISTKIERVIETNITVSRGIKGLMIGLMIVLSMLLGREEEIKIMGNQCVIDISVKLNKPIRYKLLICKLYSKKN